MSTVIRRDVLYELVWTKPVTKLAAELEISDVGFAKICKQHQIPLPMRGHWAKLEAGKKIYRPPLPERPLGMPRQITIGGTRWESYWERPTNPAELVLTPPPPFEKSIDDIRTALVKKVKPVKPSRDLLMAHPAVRRLLEADNDRRDKYLASTYKSSFDAPYFDSPFDQRRLRALNGLFLNLEKYDARVSSSGKNPHEFGVKVGLQGIAVSIDDPKEERYSWRGPYELLRSASSPMVVKISQGSEINGVRTIWEDSAQTRIETHLTEVLINLLLAGEVRCREEENRHYQWLVNLKESAIKEARIAEEKAEQAERDRIVREEKARIERLLAEAEDLRRAESIRSYVAAVKGLKSEALAQFASGEVEDWEKWALAQADRIDPVRSGRFLKDRI